MIINKSIAKKITDEIHQVINEDINFINSKGIIIYSTNAERIDTFHEAGYQCIKLKREIIVKNNKQYKGSRVGINLPVVFDKEIISAIGITGESDRVNKFGAIIKKMTEILLIEKYNQQMIQKNKDGIKYYIEGLIYNENYEDKDIDLSDQFTGEKTLAVSRNKSSHISIEYHEIIYDILEKYLFTKKAIYTVFFKEIIIINFDNNIDFFKKLLFKISKEIKSKTNYDLDFGISENFNNIKESRNMYKQALIALKWGQLSNTKGNIFIYDDFDLELLLASIDEMTLIKYKNMILKNIDKNDYNSFELLLHSYIKNNGSINKISKSLFIHKNTVQYRLNKLHKITGYNPRELEDLIKLYIAFLIKI